jgi:hypothetical protein
VVGVMIRRLDVERKILALSRNEMSLEDFENWLDVASRNMHNDSSVDALALVSSIHAMLSERDDHVLSEQQLYQELRALVPRFEIAVSVENERIVPVQLPRSRSARLTVWNPQLAFAGA